MTKGSLSPGQIVVIQEFVKVLARSNPGLKIDSIPDEANRDTPDIDAIAGNFAIEHTSIDTIENQRRNNANFLELIPDNPIFDSSKPGFFAMVSIPWDDVTKVQDRLKIKKALTVFVQNELSNLDNGRHKLSLLDVPFKVWVSKREHQNKVLHFGRHAKPDPTLPARLVDLIERKSKKLERYKNDGMITVLLLETEDLALMNQGIMLTAIQDGFGTRAIPASIDQIWYADSTISDELQFHNLMQWLVNK